MNDDEMKISVLSSGSTGNVTYIETPQHKVLVDAGLSGKKIAGLMDSIGRDINDVDSLLITHEHSDHIAGAGVLARKYNLDVYANKGTWDAMASKIGKVPEEQRYIFDPNTTKSLGDLDIESFSVSHDAAEPQFYEFHHNGKSFVILTDTGYVSDRVAGTIENADCYLFEVNHDTEMLRMGGYPWPLKQRILGDHGHLSNEDGANALMDVIGNRTKKIYLGHLSLHNNMKELAHLTVSSMMQNKDIAVGHDFQLLDTDHDRAAHLTIL
ncbi:MBL fold metallo-hydrolase [Pediococcus argentinicus]|uniref:Ribonuclease Z n=1 Tax=Pediococcus argentinicus TaxID=480391 RepID=A0A0R2NHF5_9LACO|nr:MBL fold metallo-hydrolase [Pediococcus argentinicus]KRO25224.1 ribonuclease Z [Pediococcus argentinicus]NKZ22379.1 MBL fold metallo-hydrolase [Pediococcus argentinicus]GEP19484.1 metallo-hydrolase [Pediococcus argentinicus]